MLTNYHLVKSGDNEIIILRLIEKQKELRKKNSNNETNLIIRKLRANATLILGPTCSCFACLAPRVIGGIVICCQR